MADISLSLHYHTHLCCCLSNLLAVKEMEQSQVAFIQREYKFQLDLLTRHFPGGTCFGDIWIFAKFLTGLHPVLIKPSFQYLNDSHTMYWNMIILNPSRFKVKPQSKYWYFCIERWDLLSLRFSENALLFHIQWVCRKTAGNVNWPPYHYTAVTHWTCPPSSNTSVWNPHPLCCRNINFFE